MAYITADIADLFRLRYLYTGDEAFLREKAYPMMKGAAEFYRTVPVLKKEEDGKYHIFPTNFCEAMWGVRDSVDDICMIKGLFPEVIRYAEKLGVDKELIPLWREILENLCDIPTSEDPDCLCPKSLNGKKALAMAREPIIMYGRGRDFLCSDADEQIRPLMSYDIVTPETKEKNPELWELCLNTLDGDLVRDKYVNGISVNNDDLIRYTVNCARMQKKDYAWEHFVYQFARETNAKNFADGDFTDKRLNDYRDIRDLQQWSFPESVAECLLGCYPYGEDGSGSVIYIAPGWYTDKPVKFMLAARDGFKVYCEIDDGVKALEITSELGGICRIKNEYSFSGVTCGGLPIPFADNGVLTFNTEKGETYNIS